MDCVDCQVFMQRCLDGEPTSTDPAGLAEHLSLCSDCRDRYAAIPCLLDGLRLLTPPRPPAGLSERICRHIAQERVRSIRLRRLFVPPAVAAALLLAYGAIRFQGRTGSRVETPAQLTRRQESPPLPSLHRRIEEAGLAVVTLTRRTADEAMSETKLLLPVNLTPASVADSQELEPAFQPPTQSLRVIQEGMSAGLEPVTSSARRAVDFFLTSGQWGASGGQ